MAVATSFELAPAVGAKARGTRSAGTIGSAATAATTAPGPSRREFTASEEGRIADEIALGGKPEIVLLWKEVLKDYENLGRHEAFIMSCSRLNALPFASQKYARILQASPDEEIARKMKRRILEIASVGAEIAPRAKAAPRSFRWPRLNTIVIFLGSAVFFTSLWIPGLANIAGVGISMVALAIGLRMFANR